MNNDQNTDKPKTEENTPEKTKEVKEIGGRKGLDPTRYGDWEKSGRCIDFKNGNKNEY
jgi:hypothetical protein|tara:strand:+ start:368 stop:541 length:174 start_codon:yes stop_codon:yes gene_type:complete